MGLWQCYLYLVMCLIVQAELRNSTIKQSDRRGKALKISKSPCSDPSGRKGVCTFKWDCINHNGTLMGTCMDGFIFGTCCQYDYDPLLHDEPIRDFSLFDDDNKIIESNNIHHYASTRYASTTTTTTTTIMPTTQRPVVFNRPVSVFTRPNRPVSVFARPTTPPPASSTSASSTTTRPPSCCKFIDSGTVGDMVERWSNKKATAYATTETHHSFALSLNRPLQTYRPRPPTSTQTTSVSQTSNQTSETNGTFTIFGGGDNASVQGHTTLDTVELTTISVPIPQWSTAGTIRSSSPKPPPTVSLFQTTTRPPLFSSSKDVSSTTLEAASKTTKRPNLDYRKDCGVRALGPKGRIVGGQSSYFGRWPWQVLVKEAAWLGLYQKNKCGGVLVSAKHAITAGHCQPGRFLSSLVVILGEHDILADRERLKPEMRRVKRMIVHRNYNPQNFDNDIAVLELDPPVIFRPHISPICLPEPDEDFTGKMAYVTGWGKTTHGGAIPNLLQEVQVPIMSNPQCINMFKEAGHNKLIKNSFLCAGYKAGGKDSCEGDSGGPLMVERETGQWVLAGTVSHGIRCADPNLPGVYMRVAAYRSWVDKIMKP
ncbi:hypothetical protein JTE90_025798 [Oedothorax gibbosus]|uniref:Peptidase S1 domain-containing protein n=1 Tax=Oedothorax gibbosus TaxID=931172 RepID=A0AAV6V323_9ARAC|nr:hypothetical protein JTE90_025798 [Oedothorax gibbosus]